MAAADAMVILSADPPLFHSAEIVADSMGVTRSYTFARRPLVFKQIIKMLLDAGGTLDARNERGQSVTELLEQLDRGDWISG